MEKYASLVTVIKNLTLDIKLYIFCKIAKTIFRLTSEGYLVSSIISIVDPSNLIRITTSH